MKAIEAKSIQVLTTPNELRRMADEMEQRFKVRRVGDSAYTHAINGDGFVLEFGVDQDKLAAERR